MSNANPTERSRSAVDDDARQPHGFKGTHQSHGFVEIAILSLAGLTVTLLLIAQGFGLGQDLSTIAQ